MTTIGYLATVLTASMFGDGFETQLTKSPKKLSICKLKPAPQTNCIYITKLNHYGTEFAQDTYFHRNRRHASYKIILIKFRMYKGVFTYILYIYWIYLYIKTNRTNRILQNAYVATEVFEEFETNHDITSQTFF